MIGKFEKCENTLFEHSIGKYIKYLKYRKLLDALNIGYKKYRNALDVVYPILYVLDISISKIIKCLQKYLKFSERNESLVRYCLFDYIHKQFLGITSQCTHLYVYFLFTYMYVRTN